MSFSHKLTPFLSCTDSRLRRSISILFFIFINVNYLWRGKAPLIPIPTGTPKSAVCSFKTQHFPRQCFSLTSVLFSAQAKLVTCRKPQTLVCCSRAAEPDCASSWYQSRKFILFLQGQCRSGVFEQQTRPFVCYWEKGFPRRDLLNLWYSIHPVKQHVNPDFFAPDQSSCTAKVAEHDWVPLVQEQQSQIPQVLRINIYWTI